MKTLVRGVFPNPKVAILIWEEQARKWDGEGNCRFHIEVDEPTRTLRITACWGEEGNDDGRALK